MVLQILIPQYKETDETIRPLLDSIRIQKNIDFNDIGVIIVNDGSDVHLTKKFLKSYPFEIKYILNDHKGVSATRNRCLDSATADYVMFCDADDMFLNIIALQIILQYCKGEPFDALVTPFMEEVITPDNSYVFDVKQQDKIFVHGKVYNRHFLIDNNIRWCEDLLIHEDSYFNCLALYLSKNTKEYNSPLYMWCWNPNSVSRSDRDYVLKTYTHLIKSANKLSEELIRRHHESDSAQMFAINLFQTYYLMTGKYSLKPEFESYLRELKPLVEEFYERFKPLLNLLQPNQLLQIKLGLQKAAIDHGWYEETMTFNDWIKSLQD